MKRPAPQINLAPYEGTIFACYLGCAFSVVLRHAKIPIKGFQDLMKISFTPTLKGERIPTPRMMRTRGVCEKLVELSPEMMARNGIGDVLLQYQKTGDAEALMDEALVQMIKDTANTPELTPRSLHTVRANHLQVMFNLPKHQATKKKPAYAGHEEEEDLIPLSPELLSETYNADILPLVVLAQEIALNDKNKQIPWVDMTLVRKKLLIEEKYRSLKELKGEAIQDTFKLYARRLMDRLDPANPVTTVKTLTDALEKSGVKIGSPNPPADPIQRRALYLVLHPVGAS